MMLLSNSFLSLLIHPLTIICIAIVLFISYALISTSKYADELNVKYLIENLDEKLKNGEITKEEYDSEKRHILHMYE